MELNFNSYDCGTVAYWRSVCKVNGARSWRGAMGRFANQFGRAVALLSDDGALIVERQPDGLVRRNIPAECIRWSGGQP